MANVTHACESCEELRQELAESEKSVAQYRDEVIELEGRVERLESCLRSAEEVVDDFNSSSDSLLGDIRRAL